MLALVILTGSLAGCESLLGTEPRTVVISDFCRRAEPLRVANEGVAIWLLENDPALFDQIDEHNTDGETGCPDAKWQP